jgi:hypothetical protein
LRAVVSKEESGPARAAAPCFETDRSAAELVEADVLACAAILLSMRPIEGSFAPHRIPI